MIASLRSEPIGRLTLRPRGLSLREHLAQSPAMRADAAAAWRPDGRGPLSARSTPWRRRRRLSANRSLFDGIGAGVHAWCGRLRRLGHGVDERAERGNAGDAVGDGVVHLHEEPDAAVGQAGEEPHLPQRPRARQRAATERLAGGSTSVSPPGGATGNTPTWSAMSNDWCIHPQRPPEHRCRAGTGADGSGARGAAAGRCAPGPRRSGRDRRRRADDLPSRMASAADVLRPAPGFRPDEHEIGGREAFDFGPRDAHHVSAAACCVLSTLCLIPSIMLRCITNCAGAWSRAIGKLPRDLMTSRHV